MRLLTLEQLLQLHALVIDKTGGLAGLSDLGRLESAIATQTQNVFGQELYPSLIVKVAALMRALIADHPFAEGNKRTAMLAGLTLIKINDVAATLQEREIEDFAVEIEVKKIDVPAISHWLSLKIT